MPWLWNLQDWPNFRWDAQTLAPLEARFLRGSGQLTGTWRHLDEAARLELRVDWLTGKAFETAAIAGEVLDRDCVQSSVRRQFGLKTERSTFKTAEAGIAEMMVDLYRTFDETLTSGVLFRWHRMIMVGRRSLENIGGWRTHGEAMQVISGAMHKPTIHYEAPPSARMESEMQQYLEWFNSSAAIPARVSRIFTSYAYILLKMATAGLAGHWRKNPSRKA